jgi:serine/threonine-protein kinase
MDKIGPFQLLDTIHRGSQPLFRAKSADGRIVALKAIPVAMLTPEMRERFTREAATCRTLDHPNLVRVFESGEADGMLFQAMELLEGADLGKVMAENRPFTWDAKLSIMEQVCDGLQYAHDHHMVHRDIKPANLFLENSGRVRVLDFGMVRVAESELTKAGSSLGTLNYMSPEQIRGDRCTAASDVFSAGIVFFQLATGRHPFSARGQSLGQVVSAIVFETPPKISDLSPDAPEGLEFILHKALEKDPANRIQNAGDLKQALSLCRVVGSSVTVSGTPSPVAPQPAQDGDKTRVIQRAPAAAPDDVEKTRIIQRSKPAPIPVPAVPSVAVQPKSAPKAVPAGPQYRYCPSCTSPNPVTATECQRCKNPLAGGRSATAPPQPKPWGLYIAITVAALLAVALIVVLIVKK